MRLVNCPHCHMLLGLALIALLVFLPAIVLCAGEEIVFTQSANGMRNTRPFTIKDGWELVKAGWCWWDRKYAPKATHLEKLEREAKEGKKGLWADPQPVPPWLYRRLESGAYP